MTDHKMTVLTDVCEGLGMSVYPCCFESGEHEIEFRSNLGRDYSFTVYGDSLEDIASSVLDALKSFDVSYETIIWLDFFGHGRQGAPYDMEDVLNDSKSILEKLKKLNNALEKACEIEQLNGEMMAIVESLGDGWLLTVLRGESQEYNEKDEQVKRLKAELKEMQKSE